MVIVSCEEKKKPVESHARTSTVWVPAPNGTEADSVPLPLLARCCESTYTTMPVTGCSWSSAAAVNCTGELIVEPLAGEQIFTVWSADAAQSEPWACNVWLDSTQINDSEARTNAERKEIIQPPGRRPT